MKLTHNKILITGGGSGIGLGLTERFLKENNTVIVCGRRQDVLSNLTAKHPQVITRVCDLEVDTQREALYHWIATNHPDLNVLVNNAGIQNWMSVHDADFYNRATTEINTNILAPLHLTTLFLKLPKLDTIINVTSGLAFVQLSKVPVYCATKAFFRSFTLSLRHQLKDSNIEVIEMIPPALNTDLGGVGLHDNQPAVRDFVEACIAQLHEGKNELTFGFSAAMLASVPEAVQETFNRMNP